MKKLLLSILLLLNSGIAAYACGYYPYGEDLRYCFFKPEYYGFKSYQMFYYTSLALADGPYDDGTDANITLWYRYCNGQVNKEAIRQAVYSLRREDINKASANEMITYLFKSNNSKAINYLKFIRKCDDLNQFYSDPWERDENLALPQRRELVNEAQQLALNSNDIHIKRRYTFIAIRLAFYNGDFAAVRKLFDELFASDLNKDILYYWSLHFRTIAEEKKALASFYAAQVYANAPDKRFAIHDEFDKTLPLAEILQYAKTPSEKAAVYLLSGIRNTGKGLDELQKMYCQAPGHEGLEFLLLREVNKLEDWIYTPYYSLFNPSISGELFGEGDWTATIVLQRAEADRRYAARVLNFVNSVNLPKVDNPAFWRMAKAQLEFMTRDYNGCLNTIASLETLIKTGQPHAQLEMLKALAIVSLQPHGTAVIPEVVKPILYKNKSNNKFLFAIGRELEYKGNTNDAALLYSLLNSEMDSEFDYSGASFWKLRKNLKEDIYGDYYSDYFGYINEAYTPEQLAQLIDYIKYNKSTDSFSRWKFSGLKNKFSQLYDLLGTKYIRQNRLHEALSSFKKAGSEYWNNNYSLWERSDWYGNVFDENPFYDLKYTPDFISVKDKFEVNKYTITKQLIKYLDKANNVKEKHRDYYYFLVANCYYNMTQYGNSWMMRRFSWSSSYAYSPVEDEVEFRTCNMAHKYYTLAMSNAKTDKFKALCLRMIWRCDNNREAYRTRDEYPSKEYISAYDGVLKKQYPEYYDDLASNCDKFNDYFQARR